MEVPGIIIGVIGLIVAFYFGIKSLRVREGIKTRRIAAKREILYVQPSAIPIAEEYKERRQGPLTVIDELKALDTRDYKSHPMVEKMLAERVQTLEEELKQEKQKTADVTTEKNDLNVQFAVLREKYQFQRTVEWIRNFAGICIGITGTLYFSGDSSQRVFWGVFSLVLALIFLLACIYSFSGGDKDETNTQKKNS